MADGPTIGVLALQGAVVEHQRLLADIGVRSLPVRSAAELELVDGLILPGGESTTMSMLLESSGLLEPLRQRLAGGMPALGTCAGMILLATEVTDGRPDQHRLAAIDVTVRRNAFGRQVDSFETDLDVAGLDSPLHAVFVRAPVVERVGPDVTVLARLGGAGGAGPAVVCRQGGVFAVAFHPELAGDRRLHQLFVGAVNEHLQAA